MAKKAPKTIRVRIAVVIDCDGDYGAFGSSSNDYSTEEMFGLAGDSCRSFATRHWVEVELPVPTIAAIPVSGGSAIVAPSDIELALRKLDEAMPDFDAEAVSAALGPLAAEAVSDLRDLSDHFPEMP